MIDVGLVVRMYPLCRALEEITIGDWTGLSRVLKLVGGSRVCAGRFHP